MEVTRWLAQHGLELLQGLGIVGGLVFTAVSLRTDARVRRVTNLLTITGHHRELWTRLLEKPSLARILSTKVDLQRHPITDEEGNTSYTSFVSSSQTSRVNSSMRSTYVCRSCAHQSRDH